MLSVIIPARNEYYLSATCADILQKFTGDFEIIVVLDGATNYPLLFSDERLTVFPTHDSKVMGIRNCINAAVAFSSGDYILKVDAHCSFDHGFDEKMLSLIRDYEVAVARRWTLNLDTWKPEPRAVDYYYLSCPWTYPRGTLMSQSCPWTTKTEEEWDSGSPVDNLMCFQGSMWMMSREHWDWMDPVEFVTLMWFDDLDSVRAFAGPDYEVAVVPPRARELLLRFAARSVHYDVPIPWPGHESERCC